LGINITERQAHTGGLHTGHDPIRRRRRRRRRKKRSRYNIIYIYYIHKYALKETVNQPGKARYCWR
jgi:hypothetical protein